MWQGIQPAKFQEATHVRTAAHLVTEALVYSRGCLQSPIKHRQKPGVCMDSSMLPRRWP